MAHELCIETETGKASMMYVGDEPWHGLGTKLDGPATAQEAISAAKLDWRVIKIPLYAGGDGERKHRVPDRFAIVPAHRWGKEDCPVFGIVGSDYTALQNHETFEFFDSIVGKGAAIYHTAGGLGDGERIWILAKLPSDITVAGNDVASKYLLLSNSHDGNNSVQIKFTPVRVVCQNTLTMALGRGPTVRVVHTRDVRQRLMQSEKLLGIVNSRFNRIEEVFKKTAQFKMSDKRLSVFLNRVFPDPQKPEARDSVDERYHQELMRAQQNRLWATYFFENGKGNKEKPVVGTLWAAYNGITEFVDHRARANQSDERRLDAIWFGDGYLVKARAFRVAEDTVRNPSGLWGRIWNRPQPVVQ
jgi:phage/plasmid-like protein (TIGR03299 family)